MVSPSFPTRIPQRGGEDDGHDEVDTGMGDLPPGLTAQEPDTSRGLSATDATEVDADAYGNRGLSDLLEDPDWRTEPANGASRDTPASAAHMDPNFGGSDFEDAALGEPAGASDWSGAADGTGYPDEGGAPEPTEYAGESDYPTEWGEPGPGSELEETYASDANGGVGEEADTGPDLDEEEEEEGNGGRSRLKEWLVQGAAGLAIAAVLGGYHYYKVHEAAAAAAHRQAPPQASVTTPVHRTPLPGAVKHPSPAVHPKPAPASAPASPSSATPPTKAVAPPTAKARPTPAAPSRLPATGGAGGPVFTAKHNATPGTKADQTPTPAAKAVAQPSASSPQTTTALQAIEKSNQTLKASLAALQAQVAQLQADVARAHKDRAAIEHRLADAHTHHSATKAKPAHRAAAHHHHASHPRHTHHRHEGAKVQYLGSYYDADGRLTAQVLMNGTVYNVRTGDRVDGHGVQKVSQEGVVIDGHDYHP